MQHSDVSNNQCYFLFFLVEKSENLACLMNQSTLISVVAQYLRYFRKFCGHRQLKLRVRSQKLHFFFRDSHCESHIRCVLVKYENENVKNTNLMISDMYMLEKLHKQMYSAVHNLLYVHTDQCKFRHSEGEMLLFF